MNRTYLRWKPALKAHLRELFDQGLKLREIAALMGIPFHAVKSQTKKLKLLRTKEQMLVYRKQPNPGQFRGGTSLRQQPPGTVRWLAYKAGEAQYWIFLGNARRMPLSRYLYETHVGPVPTGHVVRYRDGNARRCVLSNFVLTSRRQNLDFNAPPENRSATMRAWLASPRGQEWVATHADYMKQFWQSEAGKAVLERRGPENSRKILAGEMPNPIMDMHPNWVASLLARDPSLRRALVEHAPHLIELKRNLIELKRTIRNA